MAAASFKPFIDPGISMSVNTILMCKRLSRILTAWPAFLASTASKPAPATRSTAAIRRSGFFYYEVDLAFERN